MKTSNRIALVFSGMVLGAAVCGAAETKTSAAVAVMAHDQAFAPIEADANGGAADRIVDCPDVFEAALAEDFKVDGDLTKPVWKTAKPITEFKTRGGEMPMGQKSEIRLLYSSEALYVGATFWQPMATMLAQYDQHDQPIYSDDCLEMFLFVPSEKGPGLWLTPGAIAEIDARLKFAGIE